MPIAERDEDKISVFTDFREKDLIKMVPGSSFKPGSTPAHWTVPLSWASCKALRGIFRDDLTLGPELTTWAWSEMDTRINPCLALRMETVAPDEHPYLEALLKVEAKLAKGL